MHTLRYLICCNLVPRQRMHTLIGRCSLQHLMRGASGPPLQLVSRMQHQPFTATTQFRPRRWYMPRNLEQYLERAAFAYLGRFSTSQNNLTQVLRRKIQRLEHRHDKRLLTPELEEHIDRVVQRYVDDGVINDLSYSRTITLSCHNQGKSKRAIQTRLRQKGVSDEVVATAISEVEQKLQSERAGYGEGDGDDADPEALELERAHTYIRKKRVGRSLEGLPSSDSAALPWGERVDIRKAYDKELAKLVRQGFAFRTAKRALDESLDPH